MKEIHVKWLLLLTVILLLAFPAIQQRYLIVEEMKLDGAVITSPKPSFSLNTFLQGEFQPKLTHYLNECFGFRSFAIRLNNDLQFRLFSVIQAQGVVAGKNGYLFERGYIETYNGDDFIGIPSIRNKVEKIKFIQDTLEARGIFFLIVIAPNKARYYSDYIPERLNKPLRPSNYEFYSRFAKEEGIHFFDVGPWFEKLRDTCRYPLITKLGTHWSRYGMILFVDSLSRLIEQQNGKDLPDMHINSVELVQSSHELDYDLAEGMNLLAPIQQQPSALPIYVIDEVSKWKPRTMAIADSYYWVIWNDYLAEKYFSQPLFWYYFKELHQTGKGVIKTKEVDFKSKLFQQEVIILIGTEFNLFNFGWGFIDKAYAELNGTIYDDGIDEKQVREVEQTIRNSSEWLEAVTLKAQKFEIPLDSMIRIDAIYMVKRRQILK